MADTGPVNAVVGDMADLAELPVTKVSDQDLQNEKNMAKFSKTKEFKVLKEHIESRMKFFQTQMPDGTTTLTQPTEELIVHWKVANLVIGEFKAILDAYENAQKVVYDAARAGIV